MRRAAVVSVVLAAALPAMARPLERELPPKLDACWERAYDEAHLRANPQQKVTKIRLIHKPGNWQAEPHATLYVALYFNLRQRTTANRFDYQIGGFCKPQGKSLRCVPEWDAGSWRLESGPQDALDIRNGGIIANPNPYDAEEIADGAVKIPAKPDDGLWRLMPASDACEIE